MHLVGGTVDRRIALSTLLPPGKFHSLPQESLFGL